MEGEEEQVQEATKTKISLRDYKYLDEDRLGDYLSSINPGVLTAVTRKVKELQGSDNQTGLDFDHQYTFKVEARHSFNYLHDMLNKNDSITVLEDEESLRNSFLGKDREAIKVRDVVEITGHFASVHVDLVEEVFEKLCRSRIDRVRSVTGFRRKEEVETRIPMVMVGERAHDRLNQELRPLIEAMERSHSSPPEEHRNEPAQAQRDSNVVFELKSKADSTSADSTSVTVVFLPKERFIKGGLRNFAGTLAVCGKVQERVSQGDDADLLKLLIRAATDELLKDDLLRRLPFTPEKQLTDEVFGQLEVKDEELRPLGLDPKWWKITGGERERDEAIERYKAELKSVGELLGKIKEYRESLKVPGPALILTPLAAYT
jgi:hypothetical protein